MKNVSSGELGDLSTKLTFTTVTVEKNLQSESKQNQKNYECPALDTHLSQFILADDPASLATELGFRVNENKIQVIILLNTDDTSFLTNFGVEIGTIATKKVQAFVPFDQLCLLSRQEAVISIRAASQISP